MLTDKCIHCIQLYATQNQIEVPAVISGDSFYPHPACERHISSGVENKLTILEVGEFSPLERCFVKPRKRDMPYIFIASSNVANIGHNTPKIVGRGTDYDPDIALIKSQAEVLERICAYFQPRTAFHYGKYQDFEEKALRLHESLFEEDRWWLETLNLKDLTNHSCHRYIPMEYSQLATQSTVKHPLVHANSSGMAVHPQKIEALSNGFCEIIERYQLQQFWRNKDYDRIDERCLGPKLQKMRAELIRQGYEMIILRIKPFILIPVYLVLLVHHALDGSLPALVYGSGASLSENNAVEHALLEAYSQLIHALENQSQLKDCIGFNSIYDTFIYYTEAQNAKNLLEYLQICLHNLFHPLNGNFQDSFVSALSKAPWEVLYIDRGNCLTDYSGFYAVQVFIPELFPPITSVATEGCLPCLFV